VRESYDAFLHHQHHYFLIDAYVTSTGNIKGITATSRTAAGKKMSQQQRESEQH